MRSRHFAPQNLDLELFIDQQAHLEGQQPLSGLARLASGLSPDADLDQLPPVAWSAQGRTVAQRVGGAQRWLDLKAHGQLPWECQRCLQPVILPATIERSVRFVADEAVASQLDAESEDDVLVISRHFDLLALIEDELIMAQPIVPRHDECPADLASLVSPSLVGPDGNEVDESALVDADSQAGAAADERPNPFAALAELKKKKGNSGN